MHRRIFIAQTHSERINQTHSLDASRINRGLRMELNLNIKTWKLSRVPNIIETVNIETFLLYIILYVTLYYIISLTSK